MKSTDKIIDYLKKTYQPESIIVYGSFADGSANLNSDFDALIIAGKEKLHDSSFVDGVVLDVFIYPPDQFLSEYDPAEFAQVWDGKIILDKNGMGGWLKKNVLDYIEHIPLKTAKGNGNPADVLLTLLDNLGFTDNYMECMIPTVGVYPIATANDKENISAPLMSRFAVIDIPDYTSEEKKVIFSKFALPKVLKRMSLREEECIITPEALDAVIEKYKNTSGIRDLEQAAEHIAANALYQPVAKKIADGLYFVKFDWRGR